MAFRQEFISIPFNSCETLYLLLIMVILNFYVGKACGLTEQGHFCRVGYGATGVLTPQFWKAAQNLDISGASSITENY